MHVFNEYLYVVQCNAQVWLVLQMNMPSHGWLQAARNWE